MYIWKEPLKAPIEPAKLLTLENLLEINNELREDALRDLRIEYSGSSDYPIKTNELEKLIEYTPNRDIFEIAAY